MKREEKVNNLATIIGVVLLSLWSGFMLMLWVPLAHEVLGTPDKHPGYWVSVFFVFTFNGAVALFRLKPTKTTEKKKQLIY